MQWDFWTLFPESAHQVTWLMGGRGIECLTQTEADRITGEDADYHQRDLYHAIEREEYPSRTLHMQIMPHDQAKNHRFNPFDLSKIWPHSDYPLIEVGKLTLNRNVSDYHTEMEQAAFQPNNAVPGTGLSPDKMLLARGFSYADAHRPGSALITSRSRLIVRDPPCAATRRTAPCGSTTSPTRCTTPNSFDRSPAADTTTYAEDAVWAADGEMVRSAYTLHSEDDDYGQANTLINQVMDDSQRERLVSNVAGALSGVKRQEVLSRAFEYWRNIDRTIGEKIQIATNNSNPTVPLVGTSRRIAR